MTYIKANATKIIFMAAVFSFLGVSIPKVAGVFHMYEPGGLFWWAFAYLAAAGIDILAGYLTLVMMNKEARRRDKAVIWVFIIALMGYSWYCNWLFDLANNPQPGDYLAIHPLGLSITVAQLTPVLVAALPVFVVGYGAIAHLVQVKAAPISLEELQRQAAEAQARAEAKVAIMKAQQVVSGQKVENLASLGRSVIKSAFSKNEIATDEIAAPATEIAGDTPGEITIAPASASIAHTEIASSEIADTPREIAPLQLVKPRNPTQGEILQFLAAHPEMQGKEIAEKFQVSESTISRLRKRA